MKGQNKIEWWKTINELLVEFADVESRRVDIFAASYDEGITPLHDAIENGHADVIR